MLDADTLVVVFVSTDPYTRRYDLDIIAEIRAQLGQDAVTVLSAQPIPESHGLAIVIPGLDGLDDSGGAALSGVAQCLLLCSRLWMRERHLITRLRPARVSFVLYMGVTIYPMHIDRWPVALVSTAVDPEDSRSPSSDDDTAPCWPRTSSATRRST